MCTRRCGAGYNCMCEHTYVSNTLCCRRSRDASKPQFISEFSVKASKRDIDSWRNLPSASSSDRPEPKRSVPSSSSAGRALFAHVTSHCCRALWAPGVSTMQAKASHFVVMRLPLDVSCRAASTCTACFCTTTQQNSLQYDF